MHYHSARCRHRHGMIDHQWFHLHTLLYETARNAPVSVVRVGGVCVSSFLSLDK